MDAVEKATQTQLENIQKRSGMSLEQLFEKIQTSALSRQSQIRKMLSDELGLGYGDANTLAHVYLKSSQGTGEGDAPLSEEMAVAEIYSGNKMPLLPLHNLVMEKVRCLGAFDVSPKKAYLSLRRKKQFAMIGPGTRGRLEIGLNLKEALATERLIAMPPGGMCSYKVWLTEMNEVDEELLNWIESAYQQAG